MKIPDLKIEGARYILTLDPERRIIRDGAIIVDGQRITQVGKTSELAGVAAARVIDASEMVVTPGFCNGHMHISYAHAARGIFPDDLGAARNDPLALLPLGEVEALALAGESYKLAFTPGLQAQAFRRDGQTLLPKHADELGRQGAGRGGHGVS